MSRKPLSQSKATVIAAVVTGMFGLVAALIATINSLSFPSTIPTITPKPTVVGTPLMGHDVAVGGKIGQTISANNITLVVDEVNAYSQKAFAPEYALVVVKVRIFNGSCYFVNSLNTKLVDDFSNEYADWGAGFTNDFQMPALPSVANGMSAAGILAFQVPNPALANKLRLSIKLENGPCSEPPTRLVVFFDDVIFPISTTIP